MLAFLLTLVMCVSTTGVAAYAEETVVTDKVTTESGWDGVTTVNNYTGENFNVVFSLANYWEGGYNANVKVENTGNSVIENWYLSFALDNNFSSIWNAEVVSNENGQYVVKNASWNADIPVGGCVEFGISVNETFAGFPEEYELLGESTQVQEESYSVEYILDSDWGTGFTARMLLTNHTETVLEDWTLEFDFDREITSIWNGVIEEHEGNHYVIKNAGHNANIVSGSAITFGFNGEKGERANVPVACKLSQRGTTQEIDEIDEDQCVVQNAKSQLMLGYAFGDSQDCVTRNLELCTEIDGASISWRSSNKTLINENGVVTRPLTESEYVTLTASICCNSYSEEVSFDVRVIKSVYEDYNTDYIYDMESLELLYLYNDEVEVYLNDDGYVSDIVGKFSEIVVESPDEAILALFEVKSLMGCENPKNELLWKSTNKDRYGYSYRFGQTYRGIPIYGRDVVVSTNVHGITSSLQSSFVNGIDIDVEPSLSENDCVLSLSGKGYEYVGSDGLYIHIDGAPILVYGINAKKGNDLFCVLINAHTGEIVFENLLSISEINRNPRVNIEFPFSAYGKDLLGVTQKYTVTRLKLGNLERYIIFDKERNINLYDASAATSSNDWPGTVISKETNTWTPGEISGIVNAGKCYDFYYDNYGWKGMDGAGSLIKVSINYSDDNSYSSGSDWNIVFGYGGNGRRYTIDAQGGLDTVGHEYTHGVVRAMTSLAMRYQNEPGAINEGYADIFGYFIEGDNDSNWNHGEDNHTNPIRCMSNPAASGQPARIGDQNYHDFNTNTSDNGGVHTNNSIISHACYLMWRNGITNKDRLADLWYHSLQLGYDTTATFGTVRTRVLTAAKAMGMSGDEIQIIKDAFDAVGITSQNMAEIKGTNILIGKVVEADMDTIAGNNKPLSDVVVQVVRYGGTSSREITSSDGMFSVINLLPGSYEIKVSKDGYYTETQRMTLLSSKINNYCSTIELIPLTYVGNGTAKGAIKDSVTGSGVEGLLLEVRKGINSKTGTVVKQVYTKDDGVYQFDDLPTGNYCVEVRDTRELEDGEKKYYKTYFNIKVIGGQIIDNQNATVSTSLDSSQLRIVLEWGELPYDLDSHLNGPTSTGAEFHVYFGNKSYSESDLLIADLDLDDVYSYGPETTTIYTPIEGEYLFYVYNWSGSPELTTSGASVKVYTGNSNEPAYVFNIPVNGSGRYWTVFSYSSKTKRIQPINIVNTYVQR